MGALTSDNLYLKHIEIGDDLPSDDYCANLAVVRNLRRAGGFDFTSPVTMFVGENGVGKSTLIEAIAVCMGFNPEGGTVNFNFATRESHSILGDHLHVLRSIKHRRDGFFLRAESFYNVASNIDDLDKGVGGVPIICSYGGVSLHKQSHGESFMALVENRFGGKGLYVLDEPEAALSPMSIMRLMGHMKRLVDDESQFIVSTHSPMLMAYPGADVVLVDNTDIERVDYRSTQHYQITKRFLDDPDRMFGYLFD